MEGSAVLSRSEAARTRQERLRSPFVPRYWAFLSYAHEDSSTADWLHRALESFRVPKALVGRRAERFLIPARLRPIFRDRSELAASTDLSEEIQEALDSSRHLIVLCSPAAAQSRWVDEEIRTFKQFRPDGEVLAAVVDGEPWASNLPGRESEECFPPALRERFDEDGQPTGEPAEPIAADLRPAGDGRERGLLKIVAGMLDLRLDDLVQRDEVQRHRRWALIAGASVAGMLVTSGLAVTAIQSRDAARDQRREAESLVDFMIGDLKDKLEPVGGLPALDAVAARVLAYYQKQDATELSDAALAQRSKALTLMGEIAQRRGDFERARRLYSAGLAGTAEALRRDPDNPQRLYDHAQNVFWIGELARNRGDRREAENAHREYKRLADRMVQLDPANPTWRMEAKYADTNLGVFLFELGNYAEAERLFRRLLRTITALLASEPANREYQKSQLETMAWLADTDFALGKLDSAIGWRRRQVALLSSALARNPDDAEFSERLVPAGRALGRLLISSGQSAEGLRHLQKSVATAGQLLEIEPGNMDWLHLAAAAQLDLASGLAALGRVDEAEVHLGKACERVDQLAGRDSDVAGWRALRAECLTQRARLAFGRGSSGEALVLAGEALAAARAIRSNRKANDEIAIASVSKLIGDIQARTGDREAARRTWRAALEAWPRTANETPKQMALRAALLSGLGNSAAGPIEARLKAIGYRNIL